MNFQIHHNTQRHLIRSPRGSPTVRTNEVKEIRENLNNGKATGPGNIPAELIKYGTEKLYQSLTKMFQMGLTGIEIPHERKTSLISTIHK